MSTESHLSAPESSAVLLIRQAMAQNVSPESLRELLAVRQTWEADEARKAFNVSIAEFQKRAPIIAKLDMADGKAYARIDRIWGTIRPLLTELGLSVTWQVSELRGWTESTNATGGPAAVCHIEGMLSHKLGHGQRLVFDLPLPKRITTKDGRDVQNAAQQMGSANTYAKRYALCAALGIVTGDDLDATDISAELTITEEQERELKQLLEVARGIASFDEAKFWKWLACDKLSDIYKTHFDGVVTQLKKKIKGDAS